MEYTDHFVFFIFYFFKYPGPFASFATKKLGPRAVMMVGGLINGGGILMASLATNIIVVGVGISAIAGKLHAYYVHA